MDFWETVIEQNRKKKPVALATQFDIQIGGDVPGF